MQQAQERHPYPAEPRAGVADLRDVEGLVRTLGRDPRASPQSYSGIGRSLSLRVLQVMNCDPDPS